MQCPAAAGRMLQQILAPSVQNRQHSDFATQVFRIAAQLQQRLRSGAKKNTVDHLLIDQGYRI
jgi:hypothetical protein